MLWSKEIYNIPWIYTQVQYLIKCTTPLPIWKYVLCSSIKYKIYIIFAYLIGLLQVPSDDLSDRGFSLSWRTGVDCNVSQWHPRAFFRPAQLQARGWCVREGREIGGREVPHHRIVVFSILMLLHLYLTTAIVLSPAAHLADLYRGKEAARAVRADGAVEGLRTEIQESLHSLALPLRVKELWGSLNHRQEHCIFI